MANRDFGVRKIELIGSSGTPNLTSPTNLNLNATTVAISTDVTIGGKVQSNVIVGTGYSVGIGSTQPSQSLDVSGTIRATNFVTSNGSPIGGGDTANVRTSTLTVSGVSTFGSANDLTIDYFDSINSNFIYSDEYNLLIGTKGETGGNNNYTALVGIHTGNDAYSPNTSYVTLRYGNSDIKLQTLNNGVTITGNTDTDSLTVSGVSTFSGSNSTQVHLGNTGYYAGITWSGVGGVYGGTQPSILTNSSLGLEISGGLGDLILSAPTSGGDVIIKAGNFSPTAINCVGNAQVELYNNGNKKFETTSTGAIVTGVLTATQIDGTIIGSIDNAVNLTGGTANASSLNVSGIATISAGRIQADAGSNLRFGNLPAGSGSGRNIAIGDQVLVSLSGGSGRNIGIGELSYYDTTTGQYNIGIGERSGQKVSTGSYNVILGAYDGNSGNLDIRTSSNNVVIADGQGNIRQYINSSGNVGIKTTVVTEALTVAGIVSATSFYGTLNAGQLTGALPALDGSALIGVVGSGSGVVIEDDATPVGTAGTINFGSNLDVSFAGGVATVSGASSVSAATTAYGLAGTPNVSLGNVTAGIVTAGVGRFNSTYFDVYNTSGSAGDLAYLRLAGSKLIGWNGTDTLDIDSNADYINLRSGGGVRIGDDSTMFSGSPYAYFYPNILEFYVGGNEKLRATSAGITVTGIATATSFSGSASGLTNLPAGQLTGSLPAIDGSALLNVTAAGTGVVVEDDTVNVGSATTIDFGTGLDVAFSGGVATITASGGSLQSRTTVTGVTTSISNNGIGNTNITGFKSYALMKVGLSTAGWLRLYTDSASRSADASRSVGIDPAPGSGVIAEVVTTGISTTQIISPFVMGGNLDNPADTTIYAAITNLSGSTQAITANLTILQLEA